MRTGICCFLLSMMTASTNLCFADSASDAFLDQPIPQSLLPPPFKPHSKDCDTSKLVQFASYEARMDNLRAVLPKPIIFPDGLAAFVHQQDLGTDWDKGKVFFLSERNGMSLLNGATVRNLLNLSISALDLSWKFDPENDSIITDFWWHRDDTRTSRELVYFLSTTPCKSSLNHPGVFDPWQIAFNALISKPENLPRVWPLKFAADDRCFCLSFILNNLVTGKITDNRGTDHFLVVNDQEEFRNPGPPGSVSYYIFDANGKFESGGIYTVGYRCFADSAWIDSDGHHIHL